LKGSEERIRELEARLEEEGSESANTEILRQRLAESMEDERKQHAQDLADRDFAADQTRKKYQAELAQLSEGMSKQSIADLTLTLGCRVTISAGEFEPPPRGET
jgi:myosin heavy chain 9/10/11/14